MKQYVLTTIIIFASILCSCSKDENPENKEELSNKILPFQYSISIKNEYKPSDDLLKEGTSSFLYSNKNVGHPDKKKLEVINMSPLNITEQTYSIEKYETEYRLVIKNECNTEKGYIESVLELWQLDVGCNPEYFPDCPPDIYTYDTIRCEIRTVCDSIICKKISVNGEIYWTNDGNEDEPYISLLRKPHSTAAGPLK